MSITLDQVTKRYQGSPVVNDVSLEVGEGEFFVLLGPSGSGKSTLLRAIAGLTGVDHGRIALHGNDVTHVSARQRGVGSRVPELRAVPPHDRRREHRVRAARPAHERRRSARSAARSCCGWSRSKAWTIACRRSCPADSNSASRWRARWRTSPQVLLLDEPFGALDAKIREELRRTIRQVQRELKITTVLVTHDQEEAFALADRIGVMNLGRLLESGRARRAVRAPGDALRRDVPRRGESAAGDADRAGHSLRRHARQRARASRSSKAGASTKSSRCCVPRKSSSRRRATTCAPTTSRLASSRSWCSPARSNACACA